MKTDEVKLRIRNFIHNTIDLYVSPTNFFDKMKNSTAKLWLDQNIYKLNKAIDAFSDENDEIDENKVLEYYEKALFENGELKLDIKSMIPSQYDWLKEYLPNKLILFKTDDLRRIFK
jgi:hypothetical protein